jgi:hypothetical protein
MNVLRWTPPRRWSPSGNFSIPPSSKIEWEGVETTNKHYRESQFPQIKLFFHVYHRL